jgi:protein disulfide-isomerase
MRHGVAILALVVIVVGVVTALQIAGTDEPAPPPPPIAPADEPEPPAAPEAPEEGQPTEADGEEAAADAAPAELRWYTSWERAQARAEETEKPILAFFTGSDWCGWCQRLQAEVLQTDRFAEWAADRVVLLELDFPRTTEQPESRARQNKRLAGQYNIKGFPTIVFLSPEGGEIGRTGYVPGGPEAWIREAESALEQEPPAPAGS